MEKQNIHPLQKKITSGIFSEVSTSFKIKAPFIQKSKSVKLEDDPKYFKLYSQIDHYLRGFFKTYLHLLSLLR